MQNLLLIIISPIFWFNFYYTSDNDLFNNGAMSIDKLKKTNLPASTCSLNNYKKICKKWRLVKRISPDFNTPPKFADGYSHKENIYSDSLVLEMEEFGLDSTYKSYRRKMTNQSFSLEQGKWFFNNDSTAVITQLERTHYGKHWKEKHYYKIVSLTYDELILLFQTRGGGITSFYIPNK